MDPHFITQSSKSQGSFQSEMDPAKRFQMVNLQERQNQRQQAQKNIVMKRKKQERKREKQLVSQIGHKKQELRRLEQEQEAGKLIVQVEVEFNAKVTMEKYRIKTMEKELQNKAFDKVIRAREKQALKWLKKQRIELNSKSTQAQQLRHSHGETQAIERQKSVRMAHSMMKQRHHEQKIKKQTISKQMGHYVKGINQHGLHKRPPNSCSSPDIVVSKENEEDNQAMKNADQIQVKIKKSEAFREQENSHNRARAVQRGEQAMEKIRCRQEYENYCQVMARESISHDLKRVAAGKKNQYAGVKPITMSQIEMNKKSRGEQEFEEIFFKGKKVNSQIQHLASKFTAVQRKMKEEKVVKEEKRKVKKGPIDYAEQESLINNLSEGRYSFEEDKQWQQEEEEEQQPIEVSRPHSNDPQQYASQPEAEMQVHPSQIPKITSTKNNLKQTRLPGMSHGKQLNYSQSEQDSLT